MSYLNLSSVNLADFYKGTISIWFRFSQDSVDKARQHNASYRPPDFGDGAIGGRAFRASRFGGYVVSGRVMRVYAGLALA